MTLNRSIPPPSEKINHVEIPKADVVVLDNQLKLYTIHAGQQEVVRLELIFEAGSKYDKNLGESFFTSKMLMEGTKNSSGIEINEFFDQFGAFIEISQAFERLVITIHGMSKHLKHLLPKIKELITESVFPEKELMMQKNIASQSLKVNLEKTSFVASQQFREQIFGKDNPYGKSLNQDAIEQISQANLIDFFEQRIKNKTFSIFLSGNFDRNVIDSISESFGDMAIQSLDEIASIFPENEAISRELLLVRPENLQSSIRIGKKLFNRSHPDFFKFTVTNTILGGYFGSRLMKNIREDKGFTYGISSSLIPQRNGGYWLIGTDVKKEFTQQTIDEINKEIEKLKTEKVDDNELETAKNYMIGAFIGSLNTPFEVADKQKVIILDQLPTDFYDHYIQHINSVSSEDVMSMAKNYLNELTEVVVGDK